jgi:uncharacterized repeat protein (TIGR03803 family)
MNPGNRFMVRDYSLATAALLFSLKASAQQATAPVFSPGEGTYHLAQTVSISDATAGAKIYYTTDGSEPTRGSTKYTGAITIGSTATLRALAMAPGDTQGARATAIYRIVPFAARPVFSPPEGAYRSAQSVSISDATAAATIYYTTDGTTPTTASSQYTGALTVDNSATLHAIAVAPGFSQSPTARAVYNIFTTPKHGLSILYSFGPNSVADGFEPNGLLQGSDGAFYGITQSGGTYDIGTVFKLTDAGVETVLHSFSGGVNGIMDGYYPNGLIQANDGNFYGTTQSTGPGGGVFGCCGIVFKITPAGVETLFYVFGAYAEDATTPEGLIQGGDGNFYGVASGGGAHGMGALFKITPAGAETVLYSFGAYPGDAGSSYSGLIQGKDGNFYGIASGGAYGKGALFKVTTSGVEAVLHSFGAYPGDGSGDVGVVVQANDGNFYGTSLSGGADNNGTIFKITPAGVETVFYSFMYGVNGSRDGAGPTGLIQASDGNFFGTTGEGGVGYGECSTDNTGCGTIFEITPAGVETVLHLFKNQPDGAYPAAGLIEGSDGNLYWAQSLSSRGPSRMDRAGSRLRNQTSVECVSNGTFTAGRAAGRSGASSVRRAFEPRRQCWLVGLDFAGRYALQGVPRSAMTHGGANRPETSGGETANFSLQTSVALNERLAERCQHHAAAARSTAHRARDRNAESLFEAVEELARSPVAHADVARSLRE